ncbi:MAG: glycosyltransferase family 2 protein [Acidimicrobiales bacterium]
MGDDGRRPRVDVAVVTWNTAELTAKALRHLLDNDQGCDVRVLVHDNASEDGTPAVLAELVPEADVVVGDTNLGFAGGVNRILARSDAPWFLALNSDAWPEPGALGALVAAAERLPDAGALCPLVLRPDGVVEHATHPFPTVRLAALEAFGGRRWLPRRRRAELLLEGAWSHERPRRVDWAVGAALLFRRSAIDAVGALDERFFMYVEDLEWCWRARQSGWHVYFEPSAVVRHVGNVSGTRRFAGTRVAIEAANLNVFLREALGPRRAWAYRLLEALACAERALGAATRLRRADARRWLKLAAGNLGLLPVPDGVRPAAPRS